MQYLHLVFAQASHGRPPKPLAQRLLVDWRPDVPMSGGFSKRQAAALQNGRAALQPDDGLLQWHLGAGARLTLGALLFQAEFVGGRAPGKDAAGVACAAASPSE